MPPTVEAAVLRELAEIEQRLQELRRRVADAVPAEPLPATLALLVCRVGAETVALLQSAVDEVVLIARLTPLPEAEPWVLGMLDLRGQAVPVLDLGARLGLPAQAPALSDLVVIGRVEGRQVGIVVHEILHLRSVGAAELQPPPPDLPHARALLGLLRDGERPALVLSLARLVAGSGSPAEGAA